MLGETQKTVLCTAKPPFATSPLVPYAYTTVAFNDSPYLGFDLEAFVRGTVAVAETGCVALVAAPSSSTAASIAH